MSKQTAQVFILASMLLIVVAKTNLVTKIVQINNLAFKGTV